MAMQIQKGLVKYKDRSDIVCTYGVSDNGMQYYFLDEAKLPNGNIIVTTVLLEAVDPVAMASHIGVIDESGNEVIPCENKTIKPIFSDILLVERAQPVSENVLESIRLRDDSLAATKLVTTSASIKDNINKLMGEDGRFVFNDQFSEATLIDMNGNNLLNGEYYSFIGINDKKIYYSKNIADSEVLEYSLYPINEENNLEQHPTLNVETTSVTQDSIEKAINDELGVPTVNQGAIEPIAPQTEVTEIDNNVYSEDVNDEVNNISIPDSVQTEENQESDNSLDTNNVVNNEEDLSDSSVKSINDIPHDEDLNIEKQNENVVNNETVDNIQTQNLNENTQDLEVNIDNTLQNTDLNSVDIESQNNNEEVNQEESIDNEEKKIKIEEDAESNDENTPMESEYENKEKMNIEPDEENVIEETIDNPIYQEDAYNYGYDDIGYDNLLENYTSNNSISDSISQVPSRNIFDDVTVTISNLVELNRNLQSMIDEYDLKLVKCDASRKKLIELSKSQAREISSLNAKIARLESENQLLENKLSALTPASNGELVRVMADAQNILGQTQNILRKKISNY